MASPLSLGKAALADWKLRRSKAAQHFRLSAEDFEALCRLNAVLHKWAEDECNGVIQRDDDTGQPRRYRLDKGGNPIPGRGTKIPDREAAAIRQATEIAERNGGHFYHQCDPRGCQVYFWRPEDLLRRTGDPQAQIDCWYSSVGLACYF